METPIRTKRQKTFGQQERYEHVTKHIFKEKLKCAKDTFLRNIDVNTASSKIKKIVRRIIEKRMCQAYHKTNKDRFHINGNRSRHNMKRAVSYELYILGQVENIAGKSRGLSTHWKKKYDPHTKQFVFKKKHCYRTIKEATVAARKLANDEKHYRKISVYKCGICNNYHIGHKSHLVIESAC